MVQYKPDGGLLFHKGGVSKFRTLDESLSFAKWRTPPHSLAKIWAFIDSNNRLSQPALIFRMKGPFFVVEAVSPRPHRLDWVSKVYFERFYMKTWTFSEVLKAYAIPPSRDSQRLCFLQSPNLGALGDRPLYTKPTLVLVQHVRRIPQALGLPLLWDEYEELVVKLVAKIQPDDLRHALQSPETDESSHLIMAIGPSPTSRTTPTKEFISRRAPEMLWDRHFTR